MKKLLPPPLTVLINSISKRLPGLITESVYGSSDRQRAMRSDRRRNITAVLVFLLQHCDIASGRLVRRISEREYATLTPAYVAEKLNLSTKTVIRVYEILTRLGLLETEQQQKRFSLPKPHGKLMLFTACVRRLTNKLWSICGLYELLKKARDTRLLTTARIQLKRLVARRFVPTVSKQPAPPDRPGLLSARDILASSLLLRRD